MTNKELDILIIEHASGSDCKSQAKYSFNEGFQKAIELVVQLTENVPVESIDFKDLVNELIYQG